MYSDYPTFGFNKTKTYIVVGINHEKNNSINHIYFFTSN